MIRELLEASHGGLLLPLTLLATLTVLVKGLFSLQRSKSQNRNEFLQLWRGDHPDDLWLEVAARHLVGEYLPAALIRLLKTGPQPGRALVEIAESWPLLEVRDEDGKVTWRKRLYATPSKRRWLRWTYWLGYYFAFGLGSYLAWHFLQMASPPAPVYWVYPVTAMSVGFWCMTSAERLKTAAQAVPRWLGLP